MPFEAKADLLGRFFLDDRMKPRTITHEKGKHRQEKVLSLS